MVKQGYKPTEIGVIPEDWDVVRIGDSFNFKNGLNKEKQYFGYGFPIVNYMDVFKNTFINSKTIKGKVFVNKQELKNFNVNKGDVLFTRTSETQEEIGYSAVIVEELIDTVFSGFVLRGRPFNELFSIQYCRYVFSNKSVREQIISNASFTTRALTNGRVLSEVKIPLPSLAEQEAIATALSDADAWIDNLEQLIAKKRLIKQGAMQELLTPPSEELVLSGVEAWEVKKLGEVAEIKSSKRIFESDYVKDGVPFYRGKEISLLINKQIIDEPYYISENRFREITTQFGAPKKGDILITAVGTLGNVYLIDSNSPFYFKDGNVIWIYNVHINSLFLTYQLRNEKQQIIDNAIGSSQKALTISSLENTILSIPKSLSEQERIASILSDMDAELEALEKQLGKAQQIKQGMMQELLTGRIRLLSEL